MQHKAREKGRDLEKGGLVRGLIREWENLHLRLPHKVGIKSERSNNHCLPRDKQEEIRAMSVSFLEGDEGKG